MSLRVITESRPDRTPYFLMDGEKRIKSVFEYLRFLHIRGLSKKTIRAYAYDLLAFFRFIQNSHLKISQMNRTHFTEFVLTQRKENAAPRTINRRIVVVHSFLNAAHSQLGDKIMGSIAIPAYYKGSRNRAFLGNIRINRNKKRAFSVKVPSIIITPLDPAEIKQFISRIRTYRDLAVVYLMLLCGLRSSEALNLETSDLNFTGEQIRVRGKGKKERMLPMPTSVRKSLLYYLDYERPHSLHNRCFVVLKGRQRGNPMTEAGLRSLFRYLRKTSHIKKAHPHLLRHTFCTNLINQGVSLPIVQKLMGHSDIEITMAYVHMSIDDITREYRRAAESIETKYETTKQ